jgi:hypothetical protein
MPGVFDDANDILDLIVDNLGDVAMGLNGVENFIDNILTHADEEIGVLSSSFKGLRELVDDTTTIPNQTMFPTYSDLQDYGQTILNDNAKALLESMIDQVPGGDFKSHLLTANAGALPMLFESFFVDGMNDLVSTSLEAANLEISTAIGDVIETALQTIPAPTPADLFELLSGAILNSPPVQELSESFFDLLSPVADAVDDITNQLMSTINQVIKEAIGQLAEGLSNLLDSVSSAIGDIDFDMLQARLDGYAIFNTQELEQLHIEGELGVGGGQFSYQYFAALDITAWNSENGKGQCDPDGGEGKMDVVITARDVPINISGGQVKIDEVVIGFTLQDAIPVNIFGRAYLRSGLDFEAIALNEIGLEVGVGLFENYLGATSSGRFESYTLNKIAFYLGIACDFSVLERLDPEVAEFIGEKVPLIGIYVRGAASIPIWNLGCFFKIGAGAEIGVWYFHPDFGGLVGGSLYGKIACLASVRGGARAFFSVIAGEGRFAGEGWAAAGVGFCEPADWLNVADARNDKLCLTADVTFMATYANGWNLEGPDVNCCD